MGVGCGVGGGGGGGLARRAVRQLLAFQKRLAPGSTVNNELILSLGPVQHTTSASEQAPSLRAFPNPQSPCEILSEKVHIGRQLHWTNAM